MLTYPVSGGGTVRDLFKINPKGKVVVNKLWDGF
jgi:hypothetical protein